MKKLTLLTFIAGVLIQLAGCRTKERGKENVPVRPNLIIVFADQWRAQAMGYAGNPDVKTPNIDQLARESVNCYQAISGMPVCSPFRTTLMTGQRPLTHGVFVNDVQLDTGAVTIGKVMAKAGYNTAYIGKWHINDHGRRTFIRPGERQGFQYWKAMECTHNYNHSQYYTDTPDTLLWPGYDAVAQARDAARYIRNHARDDRPFFLVLSWGPPHAPYHTAPQKYQDLYDPASFRLRPNVPADLHEKVRNDLAGYYAHCSALDDMIGMLRKTLDDAGINDHTILLFTSDHGDLLGSHGYYKKQQPYEESVRIPMLYYIPEKLGGKVFKADAMINSEDIMPTLLGLCGVAVPGSVEGKDFSNYLKGGENPGDTVTWISCVQPFGQWSRKVGGREFRGLRSKHYTYTRDLNGPWQLFDNRKDPYQMHNLVDEENYKAIVKAYDQLLQQKLDAAGDRFLPGPEYAKMWGYVLNKNGTVDYVP